MSSFNINGPSSNQPLVQGSQNLGKDGGGGGNTGYMNMRGGKKKKDEKKNSEDKSVFLENAPDTFERSDKKEALTPQVAKSKNFLGSISDFIKNKQGDNNSNSENEYDEFAVYNMRLEQTKDPIEDEEYEIIDDDEYYDNIDV